MTPVPDAESGSETVQRIVVHFKQETQKSVALTVFVRIEDSLHTDHRRYDVPDRDSVCVLVAQGAESAYDVLHLGRDPAREFIDACVTVLTVPAQGTDIKTETPPP